MCGLDTESRNSRLQHQFTGDRRGLVKVGYILPVMRQAYGSLRTL